MESFKPNGKKPAMQHKLLKHRLYPFKVPELFCPEGQTRLPQAQQGLTSSKCEVKHEAFSAETHTQQILFGLSKYSQHRAALWNQTRQSWRAARSRASAEGIYPPRNTSQKVLTWHKLGVIYSLKP